MCTKITRLHECLLHCKDLPILNHDNKITQDKLTSWFLPRLRSRPHSEGFGTGQWHCQSHTAHSVPCHGVGCSLPAATARGGLSWNHQRHTSHWQYGFYALPLGVQSLTLQTDSIGSPRGQKWNRVEKLHVGESMCLDWKTGHTLRSRWMMGVLQWCSWATASHVSQKICSTSASVKPVWSRWFIRFTTWPPAVHRHTMAGQTMEIHSTNDPIKAHVHKHTGTI